MQFKLIKDGDSVRKHDWNMLKEAISELKEGEDNFMILEPKTPIDNSIFLQVTKQQNVYQTEIRFVFGDQGDFKIYNKTYTSKDELISVFKDYYSDEKIPNMQNWTDNATSFADEPDGNMVKLYMKEEGQIYYFEAWLNEDESLTIHHGELGDVGETENFECLAKDDLPIRMQMSKLLSEAKEEGYTLSDNITELIVQFAYNEKEKPKKVQDKIDRLTAILNNCLGWTGNGHCDSSHIGEGTVNLFCYVVDKDIAFNTIAEELELEGLFNDLKLAYQDAQSGEFVLLHPLKGSFSI